ncbi:MAG: hypothetical protein HY870_03790 [Chloroflexi bacterium]|nr:hypothetical protein [Chloroflexota bacterium]
MHCRTCWIVCLTVIVSVLLAACSSAATPAPTATPTALPPTATVEPTATATAAPTATSTSTPAPTATPTDTPQPTDTATPEPTPTATPRPVTKAPPATLAPTVDPIVDRQTFTGMGVSVAYPGAWQVSAQAPLVSISSPDLASSGRQTGAQLMIGVSPSASPDDSLQVRWDAFATSFPRVTLASPDIVTLGGEEALRGLFSDPSDGSHGWVTISRHAGLTWLIITQAIPNDNWANYEATFRAMLRTFRFTQ